MLIIFSTIPVIYFYIILDGKAMIHPHALIYSAQQDITIRHLKYADYDPTIDTTAVNTYMQKHNIQAIVEEEIDFPSKLQEVSSSPYILYYQGDISLLSKKLLAIVGPRKHSQFAEQAAKEIINQAQNYDIATISGMALGIDQLAHRYSCEKNIPTIAVLGGGFHHFLNSRDRQIIEHIVASGGLVISEFKLSQNPTTYTFPQRNRIIAGLADIVYVPEASKNSGSLITVDFAQKLGKPIYGSPNFSLPQTSLGLHEYLQNGIIKPLFDIQKMFEIHIGRYVNRDKHKVISDKILDPDTQKLFQVFEKTPSITLSGLIQKGFPQDKLFFSLTRLEMENLIYQPIPGLYSVA